MEGPAMLEAWYLWIKALHIIGVIAWMAGMLYLPRLYVYHCRAEPGSASAQMLEVMERRLLRVIINPAMTAAFVFGILLLATPGLIDWGQVWIWVKLACVLALGALHGSFSRWRGDFAAGTNRRSERFYRIANEVPTVLLVFIVVLVVVTPF